MLILQIDKQAEYFLKSFVKEFEGRAPEILEMAEEFKAYLPDDTDAAAATALEHFQAHVFLERKGQTLSVLELREVMRHICAFSDLKKFSFIEYLVWTFQKTVSVSEGLEFSTLAPSAAITAPLAPPI